MGSSLRFLNKQIEFRNTNSNGGYGSNEGYQNNLEQPMPDPIWVWDQHEAPGMQHHNSINMVPGQHIPFKTRFRNFLDSRKHKAPCCNECAEKKNFHNCCGH